MTAADAFTKASPHWIAAMRGAAKSGPAFEWSGKGSWFRLPISRAPTQDRIS
jgi:hypothetical protein